MYQPKCQNIKFYGPSTVALTATKVLPTMWESSQLSTKSLMTVNPAMEIIRTRLTPSFLQGSCILSWETIILLHRKETMRKIRETDVKDHLMNLRMASKLEMPSNWVTMYCKFLKLSLSESALTLKKKETALTERFKILSMQSLMSE